MFTARPASNAKTKSEIIAWTIIGILVQRESTGTSVGEKAVLVFPATYDVRRRSFHRAILINNKPNPARRTKSLPLENLQRHDEADEEPKQQDRDRDPVRRE